MQFDSVSEAITMGGHGAYVWSAYAITLVVVGISLLRPWLVTRRLKRVIRQELSRKQGQTMRDAAIGSANEVADAPQA
jgi:heme exporter protein D